MASLSLSSYLRRKPKYASTLSVFILVAFIAALYASIPSRRYPFSQKIIEFKWKPRNSTDFHRLPRGPEDHDHRQLLATQFRLHSGFYPETHPSRPYLVSIDETGAFVQTVEYGHEDHPLSRLADLREPKDAEREAVFFFIVPKTNGGKIKTIITNCYDLRRAEKREDPESYKLIGGVINIDTQTPRGLAKAKSNNVIDSGLIDVFATSYFFEGMLLFKPQHKGRAFTILQHPVSQAESLYHSRDSSLEGLELSGYLESPNYIDNWVVRSLTNDKRGNLTEDHFLVAKGILAQKFLVGIAEHFEETIKRLETYYEWSEADNEGCVTNYLKLEKHRAEEEEKPRTIERGSYEWEIVTDKDKFDLMLYYYALELFAKQGSTMFHRPYVDKEGKPIDFAELKRKEMLKKKLLGSLFGT